MNKKSENNISVLGKPPRPNPSGVGVKLICPICKSKNTHKFWAMSGYRLAKCLNCTVVWDYFPPSNTAAIYDKSYFVNDNPKGGYANYFEGMRINRRTFKDRLKKIEKKIGRKGKLLDVGCALGDCLVEAKRLGWVGAEGIEISDYGFNTAKSRGVKVRKGILDKRIKANTYDIVIYQDVIEHIPDPVGELKKVFRVLKPGGYIFLVTPNIGGIWSKILGRLWYHYKPTEHLIYFSHSSIKSALKEAGFTAVESARTYHVLSFEYILNRLRYYAPNIFGAILKVVQRIGMKDIAFRSYTGELEAWGQKPVK